MNIQATLQRLPTLSLRATLVITAAMLCAALLAAWATPTLVEVTNEPSLENTVPRQFGDWRELPSPFAQVSLSTGTDPDMDQPYDQTVMRTYINSQGRQVMLALAWGKRQRQEVKIHRPDLCYVAQGYRIASLKSVSFDGIEGLGHPVLGKQMVAKSIRVNEAVLYWMRIGDLFSEGAFATRMHIMKDGFAGRIPDGILVRASMHFRDAGQEQQAWPLLESFLMDLVKSVPPETRMLLLGAQDSAPQRS